MNIAQDTSHGRYFSPGHSRRSSEAVSDLGHQNNPSMRTHPRTVKRHRRIQAEIPRHYQTAPSATNYGAPIFNRSNSSGSVKRPMSFIATFASKVKNAIGWDVNGWQESTSNRNSGRYNFNVGEFDSNSDSSPSLQKRQIHPQLRRTNDRLPEMARNRTYSQGKATVRKSYSSSSAVNPSFAEVMEILSVPSSPELERQSNPWSANSYADDASTYHSDVSNDQNCDKIKARDLTKIDGDINILVVGAEGVGKSALIVRYLTKRFIGEYASNVESIYDHVVSIDGKEIMIHIWDSGIPQMLQKPCDADLGQPDMCDISEILSMTSLNSPSRTSTSSTSSAYDNRISSSSFEEEVAVMSSPLRMDDHADKKFSAKKRKKGKKEVNNNCKPRNEMDMRLFWADCVVIVYSICDAESYDSARDVVRYIRGQTVRGHVGHNSPSSADMHSTRIPILLVGNKADLLHRRRVKLTTAVSFCEENNSTAIELSVSAEFESIYAVLNDVIESVYREKFPSKFRKNKSVVRTVSGGFTHKRNLSL